jgi:hypothetical protein
MTNIVNFPADNTIMGNLQRLIEAAQEGRISALAFAAVMDGQNIATATTPGDYLFPLLGGIDLVKARTLDFAAK